MTASVPRILILFDLRVRAFVGGYRRPTSKADYTTPQHKRRAFSVARQRVVKIDRIAAKSPLSGIAEVLRG
jgi:hypothetical protein